MLSETSKLLKEAVERGYHLNGMGQVVSPNDRILSTYLNDSGYPTFSIVYGDKVRPCPVHRLVAYLKFGDKLFEDGVMTRHLDGDQTNNHPDNIAIGTNSDNMMDQPKQQRIEKAKIAASHNRKLSESDAIQLRLDRANGATYKELMDNYGLKSKSTISYIVNGKTYQ